MASTHNHRKFMNRALPERSYLDFEFPESIGHKTVRLPFFENITISEKRDANLVEHSPLGRNSSLFSWTGAKARKIKLRFMLTLPLLVEQALTEAKYISLSEGRSKRAEAFFRIKDNQESKAGNSASLAEEYLAALAGNGGNDGYVSTFLRANQQLKGDEVAQIGRDYTRPPDAAVITQFKKAVGLLDTTFGAVGEASDAIIEGLSFGLFKSPSPSPESLRRDDIINIIMWWINIIRASVLNNARDPSYGPPIVRVDHGIMYRSVPCICTDYSIDYDESAGLDIRTLLPRRITVAMNLVEVRAGNFEEFSTGHVVNRDNVAGWEAVFEDGHSLDPQPISDYGAGLGQAVGPGGPFRRI